MSDESPVADIELQCKIDFIKLCDKHRKTIAVLRNADPIVTSEVSVEERAKRITIGDVRRKLFGAIVIYNEGVLSNEGEQSVAISVPISWAWASDTFSIDIAQLERIADRPDLLEAIKGIPALQIDAQGLHAKYRNILDKKPEASRAL